MTTPLELPHDRGERQPLSEGVSMKQFRKAYELTHRLTTNILDPSQPSGEYQQGNAVHKDVYTAVTTGSLEDRKKYWEKQNVGNWGEQMVVWLQGKDGRPGMQQWLKNAWQVVGQDTDLKNILQVVGLSVEAEAVRDDLKQSGGVKSLVERINADLQRAGKELLPSDLSDEQLAVLSFYHNYLDTSRLEHQGEGYSVPTQGLVDKLVEGASIGLGEVSDDNKEAVAQQVFDRLQKVVPLLQVTGLDAQHAVAALIAAKVHGNYEEEKVQSAGANTLGEYEQNVLNFIVYHQKKNTSEPQQSTIHELRVGAPVVAPPPDEEDEEEQKGETAPFAPSADVALGLSPREPADFSRAPTAPVAHLETLDEELKPPPLPSEGSETPPHEEVSAVPETTKKKGSGVTRFFRRDRKPLGGRHVSM